LLLVLGLAAFFRLYQMGQAPPGPHFDEASATFDALDVLSGRHTVFSLRPFGREMLFVYVATPLVALLGPSRLAIRMPTAIVGILTVLAVYLLVRELLVKESKGRAQWTALLAALFLALSFWHVALNHLSFRANYVPLFETLCFLFLWLAVRTDRLWAYVLSGLFLGLGLHTYIAARFVPVVLVVFFALLLPTLWGRRVIIQRWRRWLLLACVALVVFAPLLIFFVANPEYFMMRAGGVSIFNPELHQGDLFGLLTRSVLGNLGLFGFTGDPNWVFNIPGRPGLDPVQAILFWGGLVLCLVRWRRPRYLFLFTWWLVMLMPSILAPDPIPHSLRAIGTLPVACIVSALAVTELVALVTRRFHRLRIVAPVVVTILLLIYLIWSGWNTWNSYFKDWLQRDEVYYAYHGHMADLAKQIDRDPDPEAVYIFPVNYDRKGDAYEEFTLELMHQGPQEIRYIVVDDATVAQDLADISRGSDRVQLIVWTHGEHVDADPRQVLPFYLERFGDAGEERVFRGYRIKPYDLAVGIADFGDPFEWTPAQANFGDHLTLLSHAHESATPSGEPTWVALRWQVEQQPIQDYKVSLRLFDEQGHLVGQTDDWLVSNEHQTTSMWEPTQEVSTYHLLPSLPGTTPGRHRLELVLYDPESQKQVQLVGQESGRGRRALEIGTLEITRPLHPVRAEPELPLVPATLAPGIELLGSGPLQEQISPGETMHVALYWHVVEEPGDDYSIRIELVDGEGRVASEWEEEPVPPTSEWQNDDVWRDWHALRVAPDMPSGTYQLGVSLVGSENDGQDRAVLGAIEIQGRPRLFDAPAIAFPQEAWLGEGIRLLGYDLDEREVMAGEKVRLTLYWQADSEIDVSYTVFTHLLDENWRLWGQKDGVPGGGAAPTTGWMPGEVIVDEYEIEVDADAPVGAYLLEIGMYEAATGERLPISDGAGGLLGDQIILDSPVTVVR
jgi:4-amino-4-deoxy-L-arabinose transferase-like glycosyltransferase